MNQHLITEVGDKLTVEEQFDYGYEYMHQLSAHQQETIRNNRLAEKLFAEQDKRMKQYKYVARQLPVATTTNAGYASKHTSRTAKPTT